MAVTLTINGTGYSFPNTGDESWGDNVTNWATAVSTSLLQKTGGTFTLTADVDFGASFGLQSTYYKTRAATPATTGQFRLGNLEKVSWRNAGNSADLPLSVDASNNLTYNGVAISSSSGVVPVAAGGTGIASYTAGDTIYASAATTFTKLAIGSVSTVYVSTGSAPSWALIVNANVSGSAAIAYSKLALTGAILNADISASAAIARNKLAAGTLAYVLINDGSGLVSEEATLSPVRGGMGIANNVASTLAISGAFATTLTVTGITGVTLPTAGTLATRAGSETLTNKTLTTPIVDVLNLTDQSTPATPSAGTHKAYAKTDGLYLLDSTGTETKVGAGAGGINYITNGDAEVNTSGWATYADAAGTAPVDGTGGSPNVTWTRSTSSPLRGNGMFVLTKDAANRQGQGASYDFTIAAADKAKPINIGFEYQPSANFTSGSDTTTGDVVIYVYDVTNAVLIQPSGYKLPGGSASSWKYSGWFQTASNSTSYRLIVHVAGTGATAWTVNFDTVIVGPQLQPMGSPIGDWIQYTPATFQGFGTTTSQACFYRRVGSAIDLAVKFVAGTTSGSEARVGLPSGLTSGDTTLIPTIRKCGHTGTTETGQVEAVLIEPSVTYVTFGEEQWGLAGTSPLVKANPNQFLSASGTMSFFAQGIPIAGWGSNVAMSNDADNRVIAAHIGLTSNYAVGAAAVIKFDTVVFDTHAAYSTSTGLYTVQIPGKYRISASSIQSAGGSLYLVKNGSNSDFLFSGASGSIRGGFTIADCKAGDTLGVYNDSAVTMTGATPFQTHVSFERLSGPAVVAATEKIVFSAYLAAGQSITSGADRQVTLDTVEIDTHGAFASSTFTAPVAGDYHFDAAIRVNGGAVTGEIGLSLYKNGSEYRRVNTQMASSTGGGAMASSNMRLLAGDTIKLYTNFATSSSLATADPKGTFLSGFLIK